jgi:hypothetical protein
MPTIFFLSLALAAPVGPMRDCDDAAKGILVKLQAATTANIKAHTDGAIDDEIASLREVIDGEVEMSKHCPKSGKYDLYNAGMDKTKLAQFLAGQHKLDEAEGMFRSAAADYKNSKVAGDDSYSDNELPFAYLLRREGKTEESDRICAYWKNKVFKIGKEAVDAARNSDPEPPPYDTPEQEIGRWNLFCANEETGIAMLTAQITQRPHMLTPVSSLGSYYILNGDFQKAWNLEAQWHGNLTKH